MGVINIERGQPLTVNGAAESEATSRLSLPAQQERNIQQTSILVLFYNPISSIMKLCYVTLFCSLSAALAAATVNTTEAVEGGVTADLSTELHSPMRSFFLVAC